MWGETGNLSNHQNSTASFHIRCLGCGWLRCVQAHACVLRSAFSQLTVSPPSEPNFAVSGCSGDTNTQTHTVHNNPPSLNLQKLWKTVGKFPCLPRPPTPPLLRMSAPPSSGLRNEGEGGARVLLWATPAPLTDRAEVNHSDNYSTQWCYQRVWGNG